LQFRAEAARAGDEALLNNIKTNRDKEKKMGILAWLILGLLAGFIGSKIVNKSGEGMILDILIGIAGAIVGGWVVGLFGIAGVTGLDIRSLVVAVIGSIVFLLIFRAIRRAV
jgi:uncharacterized membrane protein YeaQ/YmgE (transglycosylase-associated protein family)